MQDKAFLVRVIAPIALLLAAPAYSQQVVLEEITVTATKREQTLQEVPVAVSVVDADTIEKAQILDIFDLQTIVPSLRVWQLQSSANTNFAIRGFGNGANNVGIEPSVGIFIDGVYRSRSAASISDLPNLQRVEVLRGPQSTLFGKNASAGVISVVTASPGQEYYGSLEVVAGNYDMVVVKGDVNIPLSENAAVSMAAGVNRRDGYYDNLADGSEINERDRYNLRGQLLYTPTDNISLRFIGDYSEIDEVCCGAGNIADGPSSGIIMAIGGNLVVENPFSRSVYYNYNPYNKIENNGISMQADIDFEESTLTSITSIRNVNRIEDFDADFTSAELISSLFSETDIQTFTQELRWSSSAGESVDWMIGAFYFDEDVAYNSEVVLGADVRAYVDLSAGMGMPGTLDFVESQLFLLGVQPGSWWADGQGLFEMQGQENEALSIFSQVDWYVNDRTTITLGLNYTEDEKDAFINNVSTDVFSSEDFVLYGFLGALGGGADLPTATLISTTPCSATVLPPACNQLLAFQPFQALAPALNFPNSVEPGTSDDSETTWTARVAFDINDNYNVYASASTGFKATSWNLSRDSKPFAADLAAIETAGLTTPNLVAGTRYAGPEESTVYELGLKAKFNKGAVNVAVFDQSIEGFQSNIFGGLGFNLANAGEQSTVGLELDATYYPIEDLQLTFAGTFLDPEFDSFTGALGPDQVPTDLSGMTPASIHEQSIVASATYNMEFANGMTGFIRGDYQYESDAQVVDNISADIASREMNVVNASFGLSTAGGWDAVIWGRNLTDDEFLLSAFPTTFQLDRASGYASAPRTYGLTLRKHFD